MKWNVNTVTTAPMWQKTVFLANTHQIAKSVLPEQTKMNMQGIGLVIVSTTTLDETDLDRVNLVPRKGSTAPENINAYCRGFGGHGIEGIRQKLTKTCSCMKGLLKMWKFETFPMILTRLDLMGVFRKHSLVHPRVLVKTSPVELALSAMKAMKDGYVPNVLQITTLGFSTVSNVHICGSFSSKFPLSALFWHLFSWLQSGTTNDVSNKVDHWLISFLPDLKSFSDSTKLAVPYFLLYTTLHGQIDFQVSATYFKFSN